jgi:hypothetical protein
MHNVNNFSLTNKSIRYIYLLLFSFSFLLYTNTVYNDYNLDDTLVTQNHKLTSKGISAITDIFVSPYYQDDMGYSYEYRPVVLTSFAIEHSLFGENTHVSHFINVILYAVTSIVFFALLISLFSEYSIIFSIVVSLLFIAYPLHTEVVANIKNRDEILSLLFGLLSWLSLIKFSKKNSFSFFAAFVVFFLLSFLSKQSSISFAILMPLSLILFIEVSWKKLMLSTLVFIIIVFLFISAKNVDTRLLAIFTIALVPALLYFIKQLDFDTFFNKFSSIKIPFKNVSQSSPGFNFAGKYFAIIIGLILSVYVYNVLYGSLYVVIAMLLLLILFFYLIADDRRISIFLLAVFLTIIPALLYGSTYGLRIMVFLFCIMAIYYFDYKQQRMVLPLLFVLFLPILFLVKLIIIPFLGVVILYLFTKRLKVFYLLLISFVIQIVAKYLRSELLDTLFLVTTVSLIFLTILFFKEQFRKTSVYLSIFLGITVLTVEFKDISPILARQHLVNINSIKNSDTVKDIPLINRFQTNRPIDFVEYPLSLNASWNEKIATSAFVLGEYLKIMFVPYPMGFYYGYAYIVPVDFRNIQVFFSLIVHLLLLVIALAVINKHPVLSFGILFYLISIAVFSNLIQPVAGMMADRFTYAGSVGFCIVVAYVILKAFKVDINREAVFHFKPSLIIVMIIVLCSYSFLTIARNAQWKNHLTLMRHDIKHLDKSAQAHYLLSYYLMQYSFNKEYSQQSNTMHKEAAFHFKKATEIYPDFFNAWHDLGRTYMVLNNIDSALICFLKVHEMDSTYSDVTLNIALIAQEKQDYNTAIKYYERLISINPNIREGYGNLSYLYFRLQQPYKSIEVNKRAIAYNPNWKEPYENIQRVEEFLRQNSLPLTN